MAALVPQPTIGPSKPALIYILGGPGVGKGSLCTPLPKQFTNIYHLSVGDHLRELLAQDSSTSTTQSFGGLDHGTFSMLMQQRQLLPTETIVSIVENALSAIANTAAASGISNPIILVDGFPRSLESAALANARWGMPRNVLFFDCPRELAEARFLNRKRSSDDSAEVFQKRYDEFERLNGEIMEMYGDIVVRVDTETRMGETWDGLHGRVSVLMEELGGTKLGSPQATQSI